MLKSPLDTLDQKSHARLTEKFHKTVEKDYKDLTQVLQSKDRAEQCINYTYNYVAHLSKTKQTFLLKEIFPALNA